MILVQGWDADAKEKTPALVTAGKILSSSDFFLPENKALFRTFIEMASQSVPIDLVTVNERLYSTGQLESAGGSAYIASLMDGQARLLSVEHYAKIVREKAQLRNLIRATSNLQQRAMEPTADLSALQKELGTLATKDVSTAHTGIGANGHLSYSLDDFMAAEFPPPEHLIEIANERGESVAGLVPQNSTVMIFSMPHHLKSYFTTSLALACTTTGIKFGKLLVKKPVRTLVIQMEDFPGQLQWRIGKLKPYMDVDSKNLRILPRCDHKGNKIDITLPNKDSVVAVKREIEDFGADLVIWDVLRRIVNIDLNSPKDSALFLEQMDGFRYCASLPTLMLVHHENRKEADIMYASAGSYNLPGWSNVMIQFKRKREQDGVSHVEIEVDNKLAQSPEPMRMILDLKSETPVRLENLEETSGLQEMRDALGTDWTLRDLAEAMNLPRTSADRRLKKLIANGVAEKVRGGKKGRGGLAHFRFVGEGE